MQLPLPTIGEQRRIVGVLDHAAEARSKRTRSLLLVAAFESALFESMFGTYAATTTFLDLVEEFRFGTSMKSAGKGTLTVGIPQVVGGTLAALGLARVPVSDAESERLRLVDGDMLFVRSNGNLDRVGRSAVFVEDKWPGEDLIFASYLIRARLKQSLVRPSYVHAFMESARGRKQLGDAARTSAGQFNINSQGLGGLRLPVPPFKRQLEFEARLANVARSVASMKMSLAQLNELFASLQHRAFSGQL